MSQGQKTTNDFFPGFVFSAQSVSAFRFYLGIFIIVLKNKHVVRFDAGDLQAQYRKWLKLHNIREV